MKLIFPVNTSWNLYNFRLPLVLRLRAQGHEVILASPQDSYTERLKGEGFRWVDISLTRSGLNPFSELRSIRQIYWIHRRERPDLVHHFTVKCVIYGSLAARLLVMTRVFNSITGLGYIFSEARPPINLLQALVMLMFKLSTRGTTIIFQNPENRATFIRNGWSTEAASHLVRSSGVDLERFCPVKPAEGIVTVMLAARMLKDKGIHEFVEAARLLRERGVDFRAVLVGDEDAGNPSSIQVEQLRRWESEGVVESWGWQERLQDALAKAHIVCLPSYYGEGLPMSLVEAAVCALPIVATDAPGCREVVRNHVNGLLAAPQDSVQIADALQLLIGHPDLRTRFGGRSREIAANFYRDRILDRMFQIYGNFSTAS